MTVLENLKLGAYLPRALGGVNESLGKVFDLFPVLKERQSQKAGSLSGGEQQMFAIGRAMMSKPTILMPDEPSIGLSPTLVRIMFDLVVALNKGGVKVLLLDPHVPSRDQIPSPG
jgi:branched-chain amino acid transport system ATP-binding protein